MHIFSNKGLLGLKCKHVTIQILELLMVSCKLLIIIMKMSLKMVRSWLMNFFVSCFESINEGILSTDNVLESTKKWAKDFYRLGLSKFQ
jgi:hypothetical protein